jgi:soluble lytic murein transglycosylase-like protein
LEATGAIIILLFVGTIFSSLGGKNVQPPKEPPRYVSKIDYATLPSAFFTTSTDSNTKDQISKYVIARAKKISRDDVDLLLESIMQYGQQYDVNPKLTTALIDRESGFDPLSVSSSNARGLAQLLPATAAHIGIRDPFSIDEGTKGACLYFRMMLDSWTGYPNQVPLALASYAEGANQVKRAGGTYSDKTAQYIKDIIVKANSIQ